MDFHDKTKKKKEDFYVYGCSKSITATDNPKVNISTGIYSVVFMEDKILRSVCCDWWATTVD